MEKRTRQFQVARSVLLLTLAASLFMTGCTMVKSESDVMGEYELRVGNGKIALQVSPDRSFSETIYWPTGKVERRSGKWLWNKDTINFDQLWIPPAFAPDYILQTDASVETNQSTPSLGIGLFSQRGTGEPLRYRYSLMLTLTSR